MIVTLYHLYWNSYCADFDRKKQAVWWWTESNQTTSVGPTVTTVRAQNNIVNVTLILWVTEMQNVL